MRQIRILTEYAHLQFDEKYTFVTCSYTL